MKHVVYRYIDLPRITWWTAKRILSAVEKGLCSIMVSLDLGISFEKASIEGKTVVFRDKHQLDLDLLLQLRKGRVYEVTEDSNLREVSLYSSHVYRLKPISEYGAPTLEINGIQMHRTTGITPWEDSRGKILAAHVKRGHRVLDTCMGLGYTAIHSVIQGAAEVHTVEVDENVIAIAMRNPWSQFLGGPRIRIIHGDATEVIGSLESNYYDRIIHDPPRLTPRTGDLYGIEFYKELYRVLKPGGILFHYTGEPGRHSGVRIVKGVGNRLRNAGFYVKYDRRRQGYIAYKPRLE